MLTGCYSQIFHGKYDFPNLAITRTSQFMFPKYLIEYQNVKIVKSKVKSKKSNKSKHERNIVLKESRKKRH